MRFKNYINRHNKKNRIYAEEELLAMTLNDLFDNEESILAQDMDIGIPTYEELKNSQNTRWYDSFVNSQGQQDGGYYGSILPNYPESMFPQKKPVIFEENPYRNNPISMNAMDDFGEESDAIEENPVVLEGGVSKTAIPAIEGLKDRVREGVEDIKSKYESTKSKYEGLRPITALQKAASKAPVLNTVEKDYYQLSTKLKDGEKIPERILKENDIYTLKDIKDPEQSKYYKEQLAKMYGVDLNDPDIDNKLKDKKIVVPKESSRLSQYAKNSEALEKWVVANYDRIKNGESYDDRITFRGRHPIVSSQDRGLFATIHNANIDNIRVNKDGSIGGILKDPYNYEKWKLMNYKNLKEIKTREDLEEQGKIFAHNMITRINNHAFEQQQSNQLEELFLSMPFNYTEEDIKKLKKKYHIL